MENSFRIIYALCIIFIRFPSYYLKPMSNDISYMNINTTFCNDSIQDILYKSEYTKDCGSLKYPKEFDKFNITQKNIKQFLCLGIYDTVYKVCQYNKIRKINDIFPDQKSFDAMIKNSTNLYSTNEPNMTSKDFCNNLAGYTPKFDQFKSALSQLTDKFKKPETCFSICFDLDFKLNSLCAILRWINEVDQEVTKMLLVDPKEVKSDEVEYKNQNVTDTVNKEDKDQSNAHQGIINPKPMENRKKEKETHKNSSTAFNIPKNIEEKITTTISNNDQTEKSPHTKDEKTSVSVKLDLVKSNPTANKILLSTSNPVISNTKELYKSTSSLKKPDEKLVNEDIKSQEPPPNIEKDDSMDRMEENVNPEKNPKVNPPITSSVNPLDTETKSNEASDNSVSINTKETNVASTDTFNNDQKNASPIEDAGQPGSADNLSESMSGPSERRDHFENEEESHFLFYFAVISIGFIGGYTGYHNKKKLLAILLKGRRSKNNRNRRRPSTANYKPLNTAKLDCTLEEAVTSPCNANVTHVIY